MAMKFVSTERFLKPDPRFGSVLVQKLINGVMRCGKRTVAERIVYGAVDGMMETLRKDAVKTEDGQDITPSDAVERVINNLKPLVQVRSRRVGGATYQVPMEVSRKRQLSLAIRWLLEAARAKKGKPMVTRLSLEMTDAFRKTGAAMQTRENIHRMAEANKAFAHYAWR